MTGDRWERMVQKKWVHAGAQRGNARVVEVKDVLKLLRARHRAMVRLVRAELLMLHPKSSEKCIGWNQAIECVLTKLKERTK